MLSLRLTVICLPPSVLLPPLLSTGGVGWLSGEVTANAVAPPAIAIMMPATIASRVFWFTIFYDI